MVRLTVNDFQPNSREQHEGDLAPLAIGESLPSALRFVQSEKLEQPLHTARRLIARWFGPDARVSLRHVIDPEDDEHYLELGAKVVGDVVSVLDAYDGYTRDWLAEVPAHVREHIRFTYDFEA